MAKLEDISASFIVKGLEKVTAAISAVVGGIGRPAGSADVPQIQITPEPEQNLSFEAESSRAALREIADARSYTLFVTSMSIVSTYAFTPFGIFTNVASTMMSPPIPPDSELQEFLTWKAKKQAAEQEEECKKLGPPTRIIELKEDE